jgi:S1-C subfamily serine protease
LDAQVFFQEIMTMKRFSSLLASLLVSVLAAPARADDAKLSESAEKTLAKTQKALVTVKANVRNTVQGLGRELQKEENQVESTGTVVAPNGLTVVALQVISPEATQVRIRGGGEDVKLESKAEVTDVKLIRHDGQEVNAKIVLRDEELGLALLLPTQGKESKWPSVEMAKGAEPRLLDELIVPHRFNKALNRQAGVDLLRVRAVVKEPRTYIVPTSASGDAQGCPVFDRAGQLVGVMTSIRSEETETFAGLAKVKVTVPTILPSAEVGELVRQALAPSGDKEAP